MEFYKVADLTNIVKRTANLLSVAIEEEGAFEIARRARGTPRIANRLLRRVRDFAQVKSDGLIDQEIASQALNMLKVDELGLDNMDRKLLDAILNKFSGGPVGLDSLAAAISETADTIEEVIEPYLISQGLLVRTARGRMASQNTYKHFGLPTQEDLFS